MLLNPLLVSSAGRPPRNKRPATPLHHGAATTAVNCSRNDRRNLISGLLLIRASGQCFRLPSPRRAVRTMAERPFGADFEQAPDPEPHPQHVDSNLHYCRNCTDPGDDRRCPASLSITNIAGRRRLPGRLMIELAHCATTVAKQGLATCCARSDVPAIAI
jgi:hypothetical protein